MLMRNRGLGTTRKSVTRWERGVVPDRAAQQALADLFEVPAAVRSQMTWPNWLPTARVSSVGQAWDGAGAVESLVEVSEHAIVDRREFLALIGPELLLPIYTWRLNPGPWLVYRAHGQAVSPALCAELHRLVDIRRRMDDEHGGTNMLGVLHADLRFVTDMIKHGSYSDTVGKSLYSAAAEISRLAGWAAFESGKQAAAQQYYLAALRTASAIGDQAMAVNIVGYLGMQAYSNSRLDDSRKLMEAAAAESSKAPHVVQAMSWARAGRAYAKLGEKKAAHSALARASTLLAGAREADTPAWAYWFDDARLTAQIGRALFDLGDYEVAVRNIASAAATYGESYPRDRATWYSRIAIGQARMGDLEQACHSGRLAVDLLSDHVGSGRALAFLHSFNKEIEDLKSGSIVAREYDEYASSRLAK